MRIFKSGRMSMFFIVNAVSACIYVNKGGPYKWKHKKMLCLKNQNGRVPCAKRKKQNIYPCYHLWRYKKHTHI